MFKNYSLANRHQIHKDYFLLFYTISSFFEQAFVRCLLLFNKTWKEMRACDADFQVVGLKMSHIQIICFFVFSSY